MTTEWIDDSVHRVPAPYETTLDSARLRYAAAGFGDPLVLLHGWPQSHRAWRGQTGPLSESRRVIAPDWLGWGGSARDTALPCDYDSEVDRLARLLDALGLDHVDLACHDYGGFLGLGLVQRHPGRVRRLAILNWACCAPPRGAAGTRISGPDTRYGSVRNCVRAYPKSTVPPPSSGAPAIPRSR